MTSSPTPEAGEQNAADSIPRREAPWLNPATIKGTILIAAGLMILAFPDAAVTLVRVSIGIALVGVGLCDLWFHVVRGRTLHRVRDTIEGLLALGAGLVFLAYPSDTLHIVAVMAAVYLGTAGVVVLVSVVLQHDDTARVVNILRGTALVVFAIVLVTVPQTIVSSIVVAFAVALVVVGSVALAYGIRHQGRSTTADIDTSSVSEIIRDWMLLQDVGDARRGDIDDGLYFEQPDRVNKLVVWWVMLLLSVVISTFGILADSTAVVIGAMIIAPLMTPIMGVAAATATGRHSRILSSLIWIAAGVSAAIGVALIIGAWAPILVPLDENTQVLSRVNPNIIDMGIAFAAGAAGAFAVVHTRISSSIAGVAIAVALVPPLGVVGLTLRAGMYSDSWGSFLLFLTNLVSITLAAVVVFFLSGFSPIKKIKAGKRQVKAAILTVAIAAMVIAAPLALTAERVMTDAANQETAQNAADEWLEGNDTLHVLRVAAEGTDVYVLVGGEGEVPPVESLGRAISEGFGEPATVVVEYAPTVIVSYPDPAS